MRCGVLAMDQNLNYVDFVEALASKSSTPGGGGASAAVGAHACALGEMACNLTIGKKKYAEKESELTEIREKLGQHRARLLELVDEDARAFKPLAHAYSLSPDESDYRERMDAALKGACEPPLQIIDELADAIDLLARLVHICSSLVVSDVGVAAAFARSAIDGASLNVYINIAACKDADFVNSTQRHVDDVVPQYSRRAKEIFDFVRCELEE